MLSILLSCVLSLTPTDWYVNPEAASGDGTSPTSPSPTLGAVLAQAGFGDTIHVQAPTSRYTSISPAGTPLVGTFLGKEPPFPLVIPSGVRIVGESGAFGLPRVRIPTTATSPYSHWSSANPLPVPASERAYFKLSYAVTLESLAFDGSRYLYTKLEASPTGPIPAPLGVLAKDARNVTVIGCQFEDLQDGLVFRETRGQLTSGIVLSSTFGGSFPQESFPTPGVGNDNDRGHAGLRVEVARVANAGGIVSVQVGTLEGAGCTFFGNHDGVETGSKPGDFVNLSVYSSTFSCNESGMEIVGSGTTTVDVRRSSFTRNYNKSLCEGGYPTFKGGVCDPTPLGAILQPRGEGIYRVTIRETSFCNNALGVLWSSPLAESSLDMGTTNDPGLNTFSLDWSNTSNPPPFTVCLFTQAETQTVKAAGNLWIPNNQGAVAVGSAPGGFYRGFRRGNTVASANLWTPPGCGNGSLHPPTTSLGPPSASVGRNFSQLGIFGGAPQWASIDFGFVDANLQPIPFPNSVLALQPCTPDPCPCASEYSGCTPYSGCP